MQYHSVMLIGLATTLLKVYRRCALRAVPTVPSLTPAQLANLQAGAERLHAAQKNLAEALNAAAAHPGSAIPAHLPLATQMLGMIESLEACHPDARTVDILKAIRAGMPRFKPGHEDGSFPPVSLGPLPIPLGPIPPPPPGPSIPSPIPAHDFGLELLALCQAPDIKAAVKVMPHAGEELLNCRF